MRSCAYRVVWLSFLLVFLGECSVSAWLPGGGALLGRAKQPITRLCMATTKKTIAPVFEEVCGATGVTLKRFMSEVATLNPELEEVKVLFGAIETACKAITNLVKRSQLPSSETLGYNEDSNVNNLQQGGEAKKKLDVITNDILKRALRFTGRLGVLASEEEDGPVSGQRASVTKDVLIDAGDKYCAVFNPLDGSSNVDAGIPTGTIIGKCIFCISCTWLASFVALCSPNVSPMLLA
jgi:Fructose-1-6-bisphosphatase, N-terminal domain